MDVKNLSIRQMFLDFIVGTDGWIHQNSQIIEIINFLLNCEIVLNSPPVSQRLQLSVGEASGLTGAIHGDRVQFIERRRNEQITQIDRTKFAAWYLAGHKLASGRIRCRQWLR